MQPWDTFINDSTSRFGTSAVPAISGQMSVKPSTFYAQSGGIPAQISTRPSTFYAQSGGLANQQSVQPTAFNVQSAKY